MVTPEPREQSRFMTCEPKTSVEHIRHSAPFGTYFLPLGKTNCGVTLLTGVVPLAWKESFVCEQLFAGWGPRRNLWEPCISCNTRAVSLQTLTQRYEITIITSHIPGNWVCLAALSSFMIGRVSRRMTASPLYLGLAQANSRCQLQNSPRELLSVQFVLDSFLLQDIHKTECSECQEFMWVQKGLGWIAERKRSTEALVMA